MSSNINYVHLCFHRELTSNHLYPVISIFSQEPWLIQIFSSMPNNLYLYFPLLLLFVLSKKYFTKRDLLKVKLENFFFLNQDFIIITLVLQKLRN